MSPQQMVRRIPWHPPVLVAAFITFNLVVHGVHVASTGRAFLVGVGGALLLQLAVSALLRSRHRGAALATAILMVVIFWIPTTALAWGLTRLPSLQAWILGLLALAFALYVGWFWRRRRLRIPGPSATRALNLGAVALAGVVILSLAASPLAPRLIEDVGLAPGAPAPARASAGSEQPDLFLILADGHPRGDALAEWTGHDLSGFESGLEDRGFVIADGARANYSWTSATLISLFNMRLLEQLPAVDALETRLAINAAEAFELVRDHGYETISIGPPWEHAAVRSADVFIDAGYLNSFECHLLRHTGVGALTWSISPRIVGDFRRDGVNRSLDAARRLASEPRSGPRLVLVHLPVPHLPVLWGPGATPADDPRGSECAPQDAPRMERGKLREVYLATLDHLDRLLLDAAADIQDASAVEPAIVIFSDHGAHFGGQVPDRKDPAAWRDEFGILFAASTPSHANLFPDDVSLAGVLPRLFNAYLGTNLEIDPNQSFWPDGSPANEPQESE